MDRLDFRVEGLTEEHFRRGRQPHRATFGLVLGIAAAVLILRGASFPPEVPEAVTPTASPIPESPTPVPISPSPSPTAVPPSPEPTLTAPAFTATETPLSPGIVRANPEPLDFGFQRVNGPAIARTLRVVNDGGTAVHISGVSIAGDNAQDFAIRGGDCADKILAPARSCSVGVAFTPRRAGGRSASLMVTHDASGGPHRVPLSGTGAVPSLTPDPRSLDFEEQPLGTRSIRRVTLRNTGDAPIKTRIWIEGDAASQYSLNAEDCMRRALKSNESCGVEVQFLPKAEGQHAIPLMIAEETGSPLARIAMTGTGIQPFPIVRLDRELLDFTNTRDLNLTVTNVGKSSLNVTGVSLEGEDRKAFRVEANACLQAVVPERGSCSIRILYRPPFLSFKSSRIADLAIFDNARNSPQRVQIRWSSPTPIPTPQIDADPTSVNFGDTAAGPTHEESPRQTITLTNRGQAAAQMIQVGLDKNEDAFPIVENHCRESLEPGGSCTIVVMFVPKESKHYRATLWVVGNALQSLNLVRLEGNGRRIDYR